MCILSLHSMRYCACNQKFSASQLGSDASSTDRASRSVHALAACSMLKTWHLCPQSFRRSSLLLYFVLMPAKCSCKCTKWLMSYSNVCPAGFCLQHLSGNDNHMPMNAEMLTSPTDSIAQGCQLVMPLAYQGLLVVYIDSCRSRLH